MQSGWIICIESLRIYWLALGCGLTNNFNEAFIYENKEQVERIIEQENNSLFDSLDKVYAIPVGQPIVKTDRPKYANWEYA